MTEEQFSRLYDDTVAYNVEHYPHVMKSVRLVSRISTNCHDQMMYTKPDKYLEKYCKLSGYIARIYHGILTNDKFVTKKFGRSQAVATLAKALMDKVDELDDFRRGEAL